MVLPLLLAAIPWLLSHTDEIVSGAEWVGGQIFGAGRHIEQEVSKDVSTLADDASSWEDW